MGVEVLIVQLDRCSDHLCQRFELGCCSGYLWMCHFVQVVAGLEKAECQPEQLVSCLSVEAGAETGQGEGEGVRGQPGPASGQRRQHRRPQQQPRSSPMNDSVTDISFKLRRLF